jgi:serine/threonine-protein kinase
MGYLIERKHVVRKHIVVSKHAAAQVAAPVRTGAFPRASRTRDISGVEPRPIAPSFDPESVTRIDIQQRQASPELEAEAEAVARSFEPENTTRRDHVHQLGRPEHARDLGEPAHVRSRVRRRPGLPAQPNVPSIPRVGGTYLLSAPFAVGGMATVHLAIHTNDATRAYAVKRLYPQYACDQKFVRMLFDEAAIAARVRHPNVVAVHGVSMVDGDPIIVMDYFAGLSLAEVMRAAYPGRIPPQIVTAIMAGALRGLHAAHEAVDDHGRPLELVHRDISPQNIHVGMDGIGRVLDFGIAKAVRRIQATTRAGELKGKLAYLAPEQLLTRPVDRRADIRAAAVVLWEALVGGPLFHGDTEDVTLSRVLDGRPRRPSEFAPEVPPQLDEIVLRGLAKHPKDRFATALEMAEALEDVFASCPAHPEEIGRWLSAVAAEPLRKQWNLRGTLGDQKEAPPSAAAPLLHAAPSSSLVAEADATPVMAAPPPSPSPHSAPSRARTVLTAVAIFAGSVLIASLTFLAVSSG